MLRETLSLGGGLPRAPPTRTVSWEVSAPSRETEVSDVDRSAALGIFENKRLNAAPTLEERFIELVDLGVNNVWFYAHQPGEKRELVVEFFNYLIERINNELNLSINQLINYKS